MRLKLPKHVHGFVDRHRVKTRYYLRIPGRESIPLPGLPFSTEFMDAYQAGLAGADVRQLGAGRTKPGTVNAAIVAYRNSEAWAQLKPGTQRARRNILDRF